MWLPWIWSGGGDVLCADGRRASGCLDSRATIEALRWYAGWSTSPGLAPRIHDARDAPGAIARLFASGRLGLMTTGHWAIPALRASVAHGRPSWGARVGPWRDVAERLAGLMDRIVITGVDPARAAGTAARELDRLLGATR